MVIKHKVCNNKLLIPKDILTYIYKTLLIQKWIIAINVSIFYIKLFFAILKFFLHELNSFWHLVKRGINMLQLQKDLLCVSICWCCYFFFKVISLKFGFQKLVLTKSISGSKLISQTVYISEVLDQCNHHLGIRGSWKIWSLTGSHFANLLH